MLWTGNEIPYVWKMFSLPQQTLASYKRFRSIIYLFIRQFVLRFKNVFPSPKFKKASISNKYCCVSACVCVCVFMCMCVCICVCLCVCMCICVFLLYMYVCVCVDMCVCLFACVCIYVYVCLCVLCVCVCVCKLCSTHGIHKICIQESSQKIPGEENTVFCRYKHRQRIITVHFSVLTLILLTWRKWWAPNNASK